MSNRFSQKIFVSEIGKLREPVCKKSRLNLRAMFSWDQPAMPAPTLTTYTVPLTIEQVTALQQLLESAGFEFSPKPYTIYFAKKNKLSVAVYEKGPKLLLQGKGIEEFVSFELEPT